MKRKLEIMKHSLNASVLAACVLVASVAWGFEYDVHQPAIKPQCKGAVQGVWTLDKDAAFAAAKAEGKCTLLLFTGSWWCPYCHTIEDMVLTSKNWNDYVKEKGFYLVEQDYSYRYAVPKGQEWKSYYPDATEGWGFKCWYMNPEFLAENGLSVDDGLKAIQEAYVYQGQMALPDATLYTMKTWDGASEITYGRIAYACIVVIGPDGKEIGRVDFPWYNSAAITASEAQEFEIQSIEQILAGKCEICDDPAAGVPPTDRAQEYDGWLADGSGAIAGLVEFKTSRSDASGAVRVSGIVAMAGKKTSLKTVLSHDLNEPVTLEAKGIVVNVKFGELGLSGVVEVSGVSYTIGGGGRDVFKAKDAAAVARRGAAPSGVWSVVLKPSDKEAPSPFARGYGALSVQLKNNGSGSVAGVLGDGTKVNAKAQAIVGDDGVSCLPVYASLYGKKGGFGFVLWFKNGRLFTSTAVSPWVSAGRNAFAANYTLGFTMSPGMGKPQDEMDLSVEDVDETTTIRGLPLAWSPSDDMVEIKGAKWTGTALSGFSAKCTARTGQLKGLIKFSTVRPNGAIRKVKGTFTGVVMGGSGYGTVVVTGEGSWAVKVAVCGSCSD